MFSKKAQHITEYILVVAALAVAAIAFGVGTLRSGTVNTLTSVTDKMVESVDNYVHF